MPGPKNKKLGLSIRGWLTVAVLVLFIVYFVMNIELFKPLTDINPFILIVIALADMLSISASGLFTQIVLRPFGKRIGLGESTYVSLISSVGNFFAPAGAGFAFRAAYLKRQHGLAYKDYVSILYGNYIIVFLVSAFFGLLSLGLVNARHNGAWFVLVMVFGGLFAVSLLLSLVKIPTRFLERDLRNKGVGRIAKHIIQMLEGWNSIVANRMLMARLTLLVILNFGLTMLISWLEISALHLHITLVALVLFSVLGSLSLFVSITPANLGVKEAIYLFSSTVIGFTTAQILSIALIDRGVLFIVLVLLWLCVSHTSSGRSALARPKNTTNDY